MLEATGLENLGAESTPEDAEGAITIVSLTDQQEWDSPTLTRCREIVAAALPDAELISPEDSVEGDEQYFNSIPLYCRNMQILETLALAAGRNPTHESFQAAIDNLGDIELPGRPFASGGKPDLNDTFQLAAFDSTKGDLGGLVPISDIFDGTP